MSFAVFMLVGPDRAEIPRIRDNLEAIRAYESIHICECDVYLANDGNQHLADLDHELKWFRQVIEFENPGYSYLPIRKDRFSVGTYESLRRIIAVDDYRFVLK